MKILLETVGSILNSAKQSHMIRVSDDSANTGGFLIFQWWKGSTGPSQNAAFDDWVEDEQELNRYFDQSSWEIRWTE